MALEANPELSEETVSAAQKQWGQNLLKRLHGKMNNRTLSIDAANRHKGMSQSGILDIPGEETVRAEISSMVNRKEVCYNLFNAQVLAVSDTM